MAIALTHLDSSGATCEARCGGPSAVDHGCRCLLEVLYRGSLCTPSLGIYIVFSAAPNDGLQPCAGDDACHEGLSWLSRQSLMRCDSPDQEPLLYGVAESKHEGPRTHRAARSLGRQTKRPSHRCWWIRALWLSRRWGLGLRASANEVLACFGRDRTAVTSSSIHDD
jgi:hypothetical protein